ncbi:MAG: competence/damage-inducible protein A [Crocinitomicaceae bacterium]|nr:competence/damage-inducible protein A [Flavobacteriales bacterium]NQZ34316.1 competence/damage-inducible protein A [Crocinitomicaceae bacterium]
MKVEIISIGDELLIGQTVNTNATWLGAEFSLRGGSVHHTTVIRDVKADIIEAIDRAFTRVDVIIVTGGLGPTKDDITKHTLCEYFNTELVVNEEVLGRLHAFFKARGKGVLEVNTKQAEMPENARVLKNDMGTASGMWFDHKDKVLISLPGVPYEMKHLMTDRAFPLLIEQFDMKTIYHRTLQTQGIGESYLAERIEDIETDIRNNGFGLAYLPSASQVRLRISSERSELNETKIEGYLRQIEDRLPQYVFGREQDRLSEVIGKWMIEHQKTIGTVESCTGGAIASEIVSSSGSSKYFFGSLVTYSYELKSKLVGVNMDDIQKDGAVSESVVRQMAEGGREALGVDYCIAASGIAGPNGGTEDKPVGTVWIGIAGPENTSAQKFLFGDQRDRNIERTVLTALNLLRCEVLKINK